MKERVERILEHNPVEKQYVVETRFVGEVPIASATGATVIDTSGRECYYFQNWGVYPASGH